jgi:hypothetical protein
MEMLVRATSGRWVGGFDTQEHKWRRWWRRAAGGVRGGRQMQDRNTK